MDDDDEFDSDVPPGYFERLERLLESLPPITEDADGHDPPLPY